CPLTLQPERPWSRLLAHQFLIVARSRLLPTPVEEIAKFIPPASTFILVDESQWANEIFPDHQTIPFVERDGEYWGPPGDDDMAVQEFQRLHKNGASFIVFGSPAFWWLDYYKAFHKHLRSNFRCLVENERIVIFDLRLEGYVDD